MLIREDGLAPFLHQFLELHDSTGQEEKSMHRWVTIGLMACAVLSLAAGFFIDPQSSVPVSVALGLLTASALTLYLGAQTRQTREESEDEEKWKRARWYSFGFASVCAAVFVKSLHTFPHLNHAGLPYHLYSALGAVMFVAALILAFFGFSARYLLVGSKKTAV